MKHIILDTDFCSDCDDAVAIRVLSNLHLAGSISFDGIVIDSTVETSVPAIGALLRLCGTQSVPVGADRHENAFDTFSRYHAHLIARGTPYSSNADAEEGVSLYRRLLAESDYKITVVAVGFQNMLAALLQSGQDAYSDQNGIALVREKVDAIYLMAGRWDRRDGTEFNIAHTPQTAAAAAFVAENSPVPLIYSGWEIGGTVVACSNLTQDHPLCEPLRDYNGANYDGSNKGGRSYDPMCALLAASEDMQKAGYRAVYGKAMIDPATGRNNFMRDDKGKDCYVVKILPDAYYVRMLEETVQ